MSLAFLTIPSKNLARSITSASTTFKLNNIKSWKLNAQGVAINLSSSDFGTEAYGCLRNDTGTIIELFSFDPTTIADASISFVKRGLSFNGDLTTETTAYKLDWSANETIVQIGTDVPQLFQWLKEYIDAAAIAGVVPASTTAGGIVVEASQAEVNAFTDTKTVSAVAYKLIATPAKLQATTANKGIVRLSTAPVSATEPIAVGDNDTRVANASETSKGISEEATDAEVTAGTGTGGTGAKLFVTPAKLATRLANVFMYGDGSDGAVTISAPTTLTRDMYYSTLTVNSTLTTDGYKIFVSGTISGNGTIDWGTANAGSVGGNGTGGTGSGGGGGAGGTVSGNGQLVNNAGGAGGTGTTTGTGNNGSASDAKTSSIGVANTSSIGGGGGRGGGGGPSSSGGAGGTVSILTKAAVFAQNSLFGIDFKKDGTWIPYQSSTGGGGGGSGASNDSGKQAGGGGGGGASGGIVFIVASVWAGTFTIKATGGAGGNGGTQYTGGGGPGAGGSGGAGGVSFVVYGTKTWTGSYSLAGGAAGLANAGGGASGGGETAAGAGTTGTSYEIAMSTLTR